MLDWCAARAREPSTWRGLAALAGLAGIALSPDEWQAIAGAATALIAAIEVFRKESPPA